MATRGVSAHLSEALSLRVLLEAESGEMNTSAKDFGFCQNAHSTNAINLHFHIRVAVRIAKVGKMRAPRSVLCIALDDDSVFIQSIRKRQSSL